MSSAAFILAINLSVAGLIAAAFAAIAVYDRTRVSARWFTLAYLLGMVNFGLEFAIPYAGGHWTTTIGAYASSIGAFAVFAAGLSYLYNRPPPWPLLGAIFVAALAIRLGSDAMPRDSFARQMLYQFPYFMMQAIAALIVLRAGAVRFADRLLVGLLALSAVHFLAKPFIAFAAGGVGASPQAYVGTLYATMSQSLATILGLAVALLLIIILVGNLLSAITTQSQTDELSALLNRRGFRRRLDIAMAERMGNARPLSLIICDLDHFKEVNDTYGHASGDRVIVAFAAMLRGMMADHHIAGRIGGEEFAILLPGANLAAARLFAEHARQAFAGLAIAGLPPGRAFTASFGVAEARPAENPLAFQARADAALYDAKHAGRNCVRIASASAGLGEASSMTRSANGR